MREGESEEAGGQEASVMLEKELNMAPLGVIGEPGSDSSHRLNEEAIFFISQRVIILGNSDVRSFVRSFIKAKKWKVRAAGISASADRTGGRYVHEAFHWIGKTHASQSSVASASQISLAMFLAFHGLFFVPSSIAERGEQ